MGQLACFGEGGFGTDGCLGVLGGGLHGTYVELTIVKKMMLRHKRSEALEVISQGVGGDGVWKEDSWSWEFKWRREMFEWERKLTLRLTNLLQNEQVHRANLDVWIWLDSPLGVYSTNSAYISRFCEEGQEELNTILLEVWKL